MFTKKIAYTFLFSLVSSSVLVLTSWQLTPLIGKPATYLLLVCIVTLNALFGGLNLGIFTTSAAALIYLFFLLKNNPMTQLLSVVPLYETSVFLLTGVLICWGIEKYRKTDIRNEYLQKEEMLLKRLQQLKNENGKILQEIKSRDEFLAIASHELKTPLTSMLLKLQAVLHSIRNVSLAQFSVANLLKMLETAEQQTQRLSRMINDLLNISLITTGKLHLELTESDISAVVLEVVEEFKEKVEKKGTGIKISVSEKIKGTIDKVRIEQVITNLISNALKYGNGKPIEVTVIKSGGFAKISVRDHGIGIAPDQTSRIFELFERGVSNSDFKGLGVGLFIAHQIVKAHGGRIKVESQPNHGSLFTVELPLKNS